MTRREAHTTGAAISYYMVLQELQRQRNEFMKLFVRDFLTDNMRLEGRLSEDNIGDIMGFLADGWMVLEGDGAFVSYPHLENLHHIVYDRDRYADGAPRTRWNLRFRAP